LLLTLDAGNTRIKWGLRRAATWADFGALPTARVAELEAMLKAIDYERVLIANVAGARVAEAIARAVSRPACTAEFVQSCGLQCDVRSSYDDPRQLGVDRWAALIGARRICAAACVVVNAGTALTVDALADDGVFLGGIILPGIELMRRALDAHTAGLRIQPGQVRFFPSNTGDAILSGAAQGCAGAIERMVRFTQTGSQCTVRVVLSGGAAHVLRPLLDELDVVEVEHLVLEGLAAIAEEGC
jgi:type III pantothenate kinase